MDGKAELIEASVDFLSGLQDKTPGPELEDWLNTTFPPGSVVFDRLAELIREGVRDGWAANDPVMGLNYRRSRICAPCPETFYFSITAVYMNSKAPFRGQYHLHPYGEINLVAPVDEGAELAGPNGWRGAGWTAPAPGSHHYPESRGGGLIALFYLPAGRISYNIIPDRNGVCQ